MTWAFIFTLAIFQYGFKFLGAVVIGQRKMPEVMQRCLLLIPAAVLSGLIAKDTFTTGHSIGIDARALGLAVAAVATWRRLPFIVVVVAGVGATALVRLFV